MSANPLGGGGNGASSAPCLSGDGLWCAFVSAAGNLVVGDTNGKQDVSRRNLADGTTSFISVSTAGVAANGDSSGPWCDWDGDVIVFASSATNLVAGDNNNFQDIFVRDIAAGSTTRVSVSSAGVAGNGKSIRATVTHDGQTVAFSSGANHLVANDGNNRSDCFVHDRAAATTIRVNVADNGFGGDGDSGDPQISGDGSVVVFDSKSTNLVPGDTNLDDDIFLPDLASSTTVRLSVDENGNEVDHDSYEASVSTDGAIVSFASDSVTLVAGDTNGCSDVFLLQRDRGILSRVSLAVDGSEADANCHNHELSNDGYVVIFESAATTLVLNDGAGVNDVFAHATVEVRFVEYGSGRVGSGGHVPHLWGAGGRGDGDAGYSVKLDDGLGFAPGLLFISGGAASFPIFKGTGLVDFSLLLGAEPLLLAGGFGAPGEGTITIDGIDVTDVLDVSIYPQVFLVDAGAVRGISLSSGLELDIVGR